MTPNDFVAASMLSFLSRCISSTLFGMFISRLLSHDRNYTNSPDFGDNTRHLIEGARFFSPLVRESSRTWHHVFGIPNPNLFLGAAVGRGKVRHLELRRKALAGISIAAWRVISSGVICWRLVPKVAMVCGMARAGGRQLASPVRRARPRLGTRVVKGHAPCGRNLFCLFQVISASGALR